jgi:membrane protease subunit HflC
MLHSHTHDHGDDGHHHFHHHDGDADAAPARGGLARRLRVGLRFLMAGLVIAAAGFAADSVMVRAGQATVITRFGDLARVLVEPGLAWKLPAPIETTIPVDLRLRTTSTGLQDVGTKDGLRILVQAYVAWKVPPSAERIRQYLRAVRNDPDEAARQIRGLTAAALQVTASGFELADLVDTDADRQKLAAFEDRLQAQVARQVLDVFGIAVVQVGIERLSLPDATLAATVARMRAERETVAAARTAEGLRAAAQLRAEAQRDQRITIARARTEAADIEADSRREAAAIEARAYEADPTLYALLRQMDTLGSIVGGNTRMVLRTDAAPFNMLIQGPPGIAAAPPRNPPAVPADKTVGSIP